MSDTPNLDQLVGCSRRLTDLLAVPQPGLATWREALGRVLDDIAEFAPATPKPEMTLRLWGSECVDFDNCGNTTPDSQRCDSCNRTSTTLPLYVVDAEPGSVRDPVERLSIHPSASPVT